VPNISQGNVATSDMFEVWQYL